MPFIPCPPLARFQFTPLREGRPDSVRYHFYTRKISIHAPPRGATKLTQLESSFNQFQFTPLREGRPQQIAEGKLNALFQFTPLREGRRRTTKRGTAAQLFQFTPLREGRPPPWTLRNGCFISIHAPPRGATSTLDTSERMLYFNSRPSARGDHHKREYRHCH